MSILNIPTARVFSPLLDPARYKGAWGGRGSGKSHFFAEKLIDDSLAEPGEAGSGLLSVCIREIQKDLAQSSKLLIENKLSAFKLGEKDGFKSYRDLIRTPGDGIIIFKGMNDYNGDSIKSLEGFKRAWWEEAQTASLTSLNLLTPTIRAPGSEKWFSWNPRRITDPVDVMLRGKDIPTGAQVVQANWKDNPFFTAELEQERLDCVRMQPDQYDHIWDGGYVKVIAGAYYAKCLTEAKSSGRIDIVPADPLMTIRLFADIGGTGSKADNFVFWAAQFIGKQVRVVNYYEAQGQDMATHLAWLRKNSYTSDKAQIWLPHDGSSHDKVYDVSYESAFKQAGYQATVIPNQGKGAAKARIESARRTFNAMYFNEPTTEAGLAALGWYHEKKDEARGIGLGPDHDWSCLPAGVKVKVPGGSKRIEDFKVGDKVVTGGKVGNVVRAQYVKDSIIYKLTLRDGSIVKCTPEHKLFTRLGLVMAKDLTYNSVLIQGHEVPQWLESNKGIRKAFTDYFKGSDTIFGGKENFMLARKAGGNLCSIAFYGSQLMVLYQRAMQLFQPMVIGSALMSNNGNVGRTPLMGGNSNPSILALSLMGSRTTKPLIAHTTTIHAGMETQQERHCSIGISTKNTTDLSRRGSRFIIKTLTRAITIAQTWLHLAPKTIISCTVTGVEPVWDIEVEHDHAYTLHDSNIVSSNSHGADAFGLMSIVFEEFSQQVETIGDPYAGFRRSG